MTLGVRILIRLYSCEDDNKTHYIVMNQAYKAFISRKMKTSYELVRFAVGFAITLVHELTHAFYARDRTDGDEEYKEPFLNVDQCCRDGKAELGSAMEHALFKNPIIQVIHPIRGSAMEWERVLKQTRDDHRVVDVVSSVTFYVSPIWLYRFLTQEFWDGLASAAAPLEVFFLGVAQATQGACLDPTDNQLRWGVRELDANIEATRKNFDVGENRRPPPENLSRSTANAYLSRHEVIDVYERLDQQKLQAAFESDEPIVEPVKAPVEAPPANAPESSEVSAALSKQSQKKPRKRKRRRIA